MPNNTVFMEIVDEVIKEEIELIDEIIKEEIQPLVEYRAKLEKQIFDKEYADVLKREQEEI